MSTGFLTLSRLPNDLFLNPNTDSCTDLLIDRNSICNKLKRNKIPIRTVSDFLKLSHQKLLQIVDPLLTYEDCITLRRRICEYCSPRPTSALRLLHRSNISALSTGVSTLDRILRGGIPIQAITELVGASGTGKTQLAMQLSIEAAKRGFGTIYIDTERKLNFPRLEEIASMRNRYNEQFGRHFDNLPDSIGRDIERYRQPQDVLSNITVYSPSSSNELLTILQSLEEEILLRNEESLSLSTNSMPVRLLIVDSIALPIQHEYFNVNVSSSLQSTSTTEKMSDKSTAAKRSALLMTIASNLKRLADQLRLYVVVINQVVAIHASRVRPALGNSWHHCISIRIQLDYHHNNNRTTSGEVRHAKLLKSHVAPNGVALFEITSRGLEEWNGDSKENRI